MASKLIKLGLLIVILAELTGCAARVKRVPPTKKVSAPEYKRVDRSGTVRLMQVLPDNQSEKLVLTPVTFRNGVYVCAIENLSKPCLPKLSALVASKLEQKGIVIVDDQDKAVATLYFETWFESYSRHMNVPKELSGNPAVTGKDFAAKIEQSLASGFPPDIHKRFRASSDPFSSVTVNSNDDQKHIYVAFTAIDMEDAIDYPGEGERHVGASKNPWVKLGPSKKPWMKAKWAPATRSLIGSYNGETPTEKAVMPMLIDGIDLLLERVGQPPKKERAN